MVENKSISEGLENEVREAYWLKLMSGEPVTPVDLDAALKLVGDAEENGEDNLEGLAQSAFNISEEELLWRAFEEQKSTEFGAGPLELQSDDLEIFMPTYHSGESVARMFDKVEFNGKTYEKELRYSSLHEITNYKTLVRKDLLRGSASFEFDETEGKIKDKEKKVLPPKEEEWEISQVWQKWSDQYGSIMHGLREDMLDSRSAIEAFENDYKHESKARVQGNLFAENTDGIAIPDEPKKYTGRIKNPMYEIWAKLNFRKNAPTLELSFLDEKCCNKPYAIKGRRQLSPEEWLEQNEPAYWIWPEEAALFADLPKIKKRREYRIPRSKVRSKSAAFFQVKQSKKFMAFYTVSFPAGIPDDLAYKMFHTWLNRLRDKKKGMGLRSYLWVAERQEGKHRDKAIQTLNNKRRNGLAQAKTEDEKKKINEFYDKKIEDWKPTHSIHFHLLTNNFMPIWTANHYMKASLKTQKNRGEYSFLKDFDTDKYNGVDVKFVGNNRKKLGYYLTKYITKNDTAIEHSVWHCSRNISALFTEQLSEEEKREHMWRMLQEKYGKHSDGTEKEGAQAPVYRKHGRYVDKTWIPPWVLAKANGLLIDTNQEIFDQFDTGEQLEDGLRSGYKAMPLDLIWKELRRIKQTPLKKRRMFWQERFQAGIKAAKKKLIKALFNGADRKETNDKLLTLRSWAEIEGFAF